MTSVQGMNHTTYHCLRMTEVLLKHSHKTIVLLPGLRQRISNHIIRNSRRSTLCTITHYDVIEGQRDTEIDLVDWKHYYSNLSVLTYSYSLCSRGTYIHSSLPRSTRPLVWRGVG